MINDSEIFHARTYDAAKARAYYLRTRKLKGRQVSSAPPGSSRDNKRTTETSLAKFGGKPNRANTKSRRAELLAQKEALEKRLDRLREVLSSLVDAAKKRSGGDPNKNKKDAKDSAPETKVDKADRNKAEKDGKPLTAKQKANKAKQAKEAYEKENPNSLSTDVDILKEQVKDIQSKIQTALKSAQERRTKAGKNDSKSGSKPNNDGPRGR